MKRRGKRALILPPDGLPPHGRKAPGRGRQVDRGASFAQTGPEDLTHGDGPRTIVCASLSDDLQLSMPRSEAPGRFAMLPINDLARHHAPLRAEIERAIEKVISSGWFALGPSVEAFEREFAAYCSAGHAVGVGNGTDAILLALVALGVGAGDEVITVPNAGPYASSAIGAVGAVPVFTDVRSCDDLLDPGGISEKIGPRTRALIVPHLYGRVADLDAIQAVAASVGVAIIEDCAQAHGARFRGRPVGGIGVLGCFSFYPTKNLGACGDGGAVTTSDDVLAERLRRLRQYGWGQKYRTLESRGRNSRLDEIQAAILLEKLPHLSDWNRRRNAIGRTYSEKIVHERITVPRVDEEDVVHLYVVRSPDREGLRRHLARHDIATEVHYPIPDHRQAAFDGAFAALALPESERSSEEVLSLPCFPEMTEAEVNRVVAACLDWRD